MNPLNLPQWLVIRYRIHQAERRIADLQAEESYMTYDFSPGWSTVSYRQEKYDAAKPLRDAIREERRLVAELRRQLKAL